MPEPLLESGELLQQRLGSTGQSFTYALSRLSCSQRGEAGDLAVGCELRLGMEEMQQAQPVVQVGDLVVAALDGVPTGKGI